MGLSLNEYGITSIETDEVEVAKEWQIPTLVEVGNIKGDLQIHTDWSDGRDSMELMITGAKKRACQYVAIIDHSMGRGIATVLGVERLDQPHHRATRDRGPHRGR